MSLADRIERYWNKRSSGYSSSINKEMNSFKKTAWQSIIKNYSEKDKELKALDVGTGPGFFAILMAELGYQVTAVDASIEMLQEAKMNIEYAGFKVSLIKSDAHKINLPGESFDLIVSRNLTWTLTNPVEAYKEWYRLLKPKGKVLVFDANWYLRLSNNELQKKYEYCRKVAREKGFTESITEEQQKEIEAIARKLPLTYKERPEWDRDTFITCGFKEIKITENINELIYDDIEKTLCASTPMFVICAYKSG